MNKPIPHSLFLVAQEAEDQINDAEQTGERMPSSRSILADLLRVICALKPIVMAEG